MVYNEFLGLADRIEGNLDPTVALGLSSVKDYSLAAPFIDLAKTMRPWNVQTPDGKIDYAQMMDDGTIDASGWLTRLPDGADFAHTTWSRSGDPAFGAEDRKGIHVLTWEGEGTVKLGGHVKILSQEEGRIVFDSTSGGLISLKILATDPNGTGNYIRDISMVAEKNLALHEAGAIFNPEWLDLIADARQLRFMDWMKTNNSTIQGPSDMASPDGGDWMTKGVPVEVMVALANEVGTDPWFNMPHNASEDYIRTFATYVRDHLDPALKATVEFSNEVWNFNFRHTGELNAVARERGVDIKEIVIERATQVARIWDEVFGDEADARVVNALATQAGSSWRSDKLLEIEHAQTGAESIFDVLAVTTYFGSGMSKVLETSEQLLAAVEDPDVDAKALLVKMLHDPDLRDSLPRVFENLAGQKAVADKYGLGLVAYEGGQHVHYSVKGEAAAVAAKLNPFLADFVRSEEMASLYEALWDGWEEVSDGPFMQFGDVGKPSTYGSWGLRSWLGDENPRAAMLDDLNATRTPWWEDAGRGEAFGHGVTLSGTAGDDVLAGTRAEDILLGGAGNDTLVGGAGNDRLSGGDGDDVAVLSGNAGDYTVRVEGTGHRLVGPDGSDFVIGIEKFSFADGIRELSGLRLVTDDGTGGAGMQATGPAPGSPEALLAGMDKVLTGTDAADLLKGSTAAEALLGLAGNDTLDGKAGNDLLVGGDGADRLSGGSGDDFLYGGDGADRLIGGSGDDFLYGGDGADRLTGGTGADFLDGGDGADRLSGRAGDDFLYGGAGRDTLFGGAGNDVFIFGGEGTQGERDMIGDFTAGDQIDLRAANLAPGTTVEDIAFQMSNGRLMLDYGSGEIVLAKVGMADLGIVDVLFA